MGSVLVWTGSLETALRWALEDLGSGTVTWGPPQPVKLSGPGEVPASCDGVHERCAT